MTTYTFKQDKDKSPQSWVLKDRLLAQTEAGGGGADLSKQAPGP